MNIKETIKDLRKQFPLFYFEEHKGDFTDDKVFIRVMYTENHETLIDPFMLNDRIGELLKIHISQEKEQELEKQFPNLSFIVRYYVSEDEKDTIVHAKNTDSSEELGEYSSSDLKTFKKLDKVVAKAKTLGKVVCTNCHKMHNVEHQVFYKLFCQDCFENVDWVRREVKSSWRPNFYE